MSEFQPVTFRYREPFTGTVRAGDRTASWTIDEVTFDWARDEKPQPPHWLVFKCHSELCDENGEDIPVEVLALLDLDGGLSAAFDREFRAAWIAVEANG
jgi:hypothetical protein